MSEQQRRQLEELRRDLAGLKSPDSGACGPEDPPVFIQILFDLEHEIYGGRRPTGMEQLPRFSEDYGCGPFFFEMPLALYRQKLAAGYRFDEVYRDANGKLMAKP
jgi:hypothetical protein